MVWAQANYVFGNVRTIVRSTKRADVCRFNIETTLDFNANVTSLAAVIVPFFDPLR